MKTRSSVSDRAMDKPRAVAELSEAALGANFRALSAQVPSHDLIAMVKADGYGHGAEWVARTLLRYVRSDRLNAFGVATLEEGERLRASLRRSAGIRILVFSGAGPWSEQKGQRCERAGLVPVIASEEDWRAFSRGGWLGRIPYELKFNTGMNRLGIPAAEASRIVSRLRKHSNDWLPAGVLSHLAMGQDPHCRLSREQASSFKGIRAEFLSLSSRIRFHLANSAAIWNARAWKLDELTQTARVGISLYGVRPYPEARPRGLRVVMTLKGVVLAVHRLSGGQRVGYDGTYRVPNGSRQEWAATLGFGYADGLSRSLGGRGSVWLSGRKAEILGRVSMDLMTVRCTRSTRCGQYAELLGPHVDPWRLAAEGGTVPYDLLTSVSARVQRIYV